MRLPRPHPRAPVLKLLTMAALLLLPHAPAAAQMSKLDKATLIETLRQEGLRDLLKHLALTELGDDPLLQKQVLASEYLLDYEEHLGARRMDEARRAFELAADTRREMIEQHRDHEQRPMWQTQLAEQLLFEGLSTLHQNADRFYEFGVTTAEQRQAFEAVAAETIELLEDADVRFFNLQSELPREPDHTEKRIDTGLWDRMINQYYNARTQYLLAHALYYVGLLPDHHPYFQRLGQAPNPRIVRQRPNIEQERARILALASERLDQLLAGPHAQTWGIEPGCRSLLGRVQGALGRIDDGLANVEKVVQMRLGDAQEITARLARARLLERKGQVAAARDELTLLTTHQVAQANLLWRLLVVDALHRAAAREADAKPADQRAAALSRAYQPYLDLLAEAPPDAGESLRTYIYRRWVDGVGDQTDLDGQPAVVVSAIGRMLRIESQNLAMESDPSAGAKLRQAIDVNKGLLDRSDLPPPIRAEAMYNQALAMYFVDRDDPMRTLAAATLLVDLADAFAEMPLGEEAITTAMRGVLHPLHARAAQIQDIDQAYRRGAAVLFERYPGSPAANDERLYFAARVLIPASQWQQASETLGRVPFGHRDYLQAQRERLYIRLHLLAAPESRDLADAQRLVLIEALIADARRLEDEATQAASAGGAENGTAAVARNAAGHARLVHSDVLALGQRTDDAIALLDDFEQRYLADTELMREALSRRIVLRSRAGQLDAAAAEAERMMQSFPDAAAGVIDQVLTDLDHQAEALRLEAARETVDRRREALTAQAVSMSAVAEKMAQLLVRWAEGEGYTPRQMLPYQLVLARSMRLANRADEAHAVIEPLMVRYADSVEVIREAAEIHFARDDNESLNQAGQLFTQLIEAMPLNEDGSYPQAYFAAWMRYLQVCDRLRQRTEDINLSVRQLKLADPNLGGEPYKSELEKLMNRYHR